MKYKKIKKSVYKNVSICIIIVFLYIRLFVPMINGYINLLGKCFNKRYPVKNIYNLFDCISVVCTNKIIYLICSIIALIFVFLVFNVLFTRKRIKAEKEGINFKQKNGTHGTANFTIAEEIKILKIGDEEKTPGILLGKTLESDEIITLPDECKSLNRNVMIWGASGSRQINKLYYSKCFENSKPRKRNYEERTRNSCITRKKCSLY